MTITSRRAVAHAGFSLLLLALLLAVARPPLDAQSLSAQQLEAKLATKVHLPAGTLSVAALATVLSEQTGARIIVDTALQERIVTIAIQDTNAAFALDALAELNDWRWYQTAPDAVLLTRKRRLVPQDITQLSAAVQSALPADARCYLGIGAPSPTAPKTAETTSARPAKQVRAAAPPPSILEQIAPKMGAAWIKQPLLLLEALKPGILDGAPVPYARLTPEQKNMLSAFMVLKALSNLSPNGDKMLSGTMRLDLLDSSVLEVSLHGNDFIAIGKTTKDMVGGKLFTNYIGGGAQIPELTKHDKAAPPVPLKP